MDHSEEHATYSFYKYKPLDKTSGCIRLLRFLASCSPNTQSRRTIGPTKASIECALETYELDQVPQYVALSYTWGQHQPSQAILVGGKLMHVGENLHAVLSVLKQRRHAYFSEEPDREAELIQHHFWIDAICVNQDDFDERGHQVNLMARIFSEASCVIAWLGPKTQNSWLGTHIIRTGESHSVPDVRGSNAWNLDDVYFQHKAEKRAEAQTAIIDLLSRSYWERMWVVQEYLLPRNLMLLCGDNGVWWESMDRNFLSKSPTELALFWSGRSMVTDYTTTGWWNLNEARRRWQASSGRMTRESQTLDRLLRQFHRGQCRDVRDRVYALLSLVKSPAAATSAVLSADYNISARRLYYRVISHLRHFGCLTNFLEWANFRLLLSQALEVPQDDDFRLHESLYEMIDVLQDGKLLQLGVAEQVAAALAPSFRRKLGCDNLVTTRVLARLQTFPRDEDPDAWRVFEQATDIIIPCLTQTTTTFRIPVTVAEILKGEDARLKKESKTSSGEDAAEFIRTVRAMLEPEEDWLHFG